MSDYKRWISYIYYYEKNVKKNNIGYARMETRGDITKFTIHINVLSVIEPMSIYVLYREGGSDLKGIKIGMITMDKGIGHGVYSVYTYNIMDTGIDINSISGILIYHEKNRFYASEWDDKTIDIEMFREYEKDAGKEREVEEESKIADKIEEFGENADENDNMREQALDDNEESAEENNVQEEPEPDITTDYLEQIENAGSVQGLFNHKNDELSTAAENMLKSYPYMYPFEEDDIDACVRIEPKDIENLPINTWIIANNSFLLKGYYGYRHIILFKMGKDNPRYMVGVPGIHHNHENFIANMFGFRLFRPIKKTVDVRGEFGYWCIDIGN